MPRPRVVVFDLGKVLLDFDYGRAARRLAPRCHLDEQSIRRLIDQSPLLHQLESGRLTDREFFRAFREAAGHPDDFDGFARDFADIFDPIPGMIELHRRLAGTGIPTFIFSNTNPFAIDHIRQEHPFFSRFTDFVLSYEHGAMKPDPDIYQVVENKVRSRGPEILYIDDRPENVEMAATRGWQTILQTDPQITAAAIQAAGLLPAENPGPG